MLEHVKGSCLCGAIQFEIDSINPEICACHCDTCRKINAGPFFYLPTMPVEKINSQDWNHISHYMTSDWGERGFCPTCGTYLYFGRRDKTKVAFNAELFEEVVENGTFAVQIWCASKPDYYEFKNETIMEDYE